MEHPLLLLISVIKALLEVAAMSLLAQGVLRILAGHSYRQNFAYRLFQVIAAPAVLLARKLMPAFISQQYSGLITFLLLFGLWVAALYAKVHVCHAQQLACITT